jgi:hypothetical protein
MLALELAELSEAGYELALTGFENIEIDALLADATPTEQNLRRRMQMPTSRYEPTTYLRQTGGGGVPRGRCLGHRLAPVDLWRCHRPEPWSPR